MGALTFCRFKQFGITHRLSPPKQDQQKHKKPKSNSKRREDPPTPPKSQESSKLGRAIKSESNDKIGLLVSYGCAYLGLVGKPVVHETKQEREKRKLIEMKLKREREKQKQELKKDKKPRFI